MHHNEEMAPTMAMTRGVGTLRVQAFGEPGVYGVAGEHLPLTPKQLALVTIVYGHAPRGLPRLSAAEILWGPGRPARQRQGIRQLLSDIRKRVGHSIIDTPSDVLRPTPSVASDLAEFERALREGGSLEEAARLLLRGFAVPRATATETYEDWREGRQARLRRDLRSKASTRLRTTLDGGDWTDAKDAAEALYLLDPQDVDVIVKVIETRGRTSALASAEAAFAQYVESLQPTEVPATRIVMAIERARAVGRQASRWLPRPEAQRAFVGRREELGIARAVMDDVRQERFRVLLVSGESGIGKTRLLDEVHREAVLKDFRCLRAQPVALERNIPLNPLLDALSQTDLQSHLAELGRPWSSVIAGLLPPGVLHEPPEEPPPIHPDSLSRRLLDSFALLFERLAQEQPTILFLDDLQWADATTVAALQFLQRRWTGGAMGVFATVRPELVSATDPVAKYLTGAPELSVRHVDLQPLSTPDSLELVSTIGEDRVREPHALRLCAIAGHHPLYLGELTREFLAGRVILPELPSDQMAIPTSLGQMLDRRLQTMDDDAMTVAGVLAVATRRLRISVIAKLTRMTLYQVAQAVETLARGRFVEIERDQVRIAHELFRSAVYRRLSEPRRALHHRAVAAQLQADSPDEHPGELAFHYARAGEDELAARYGWIAARRALEAGALAEAIRLFEIVSKRELDPVKQADAMAQLARALELARDMTKANPQLRLAAERLRSTGRPREARRLEIKRIDGLAELATAPVPELIAALAGIKAVSRQEDDWETVALALDAELHLLHRIGDVEGIRGVLGQMRETATKDQPEAKLLSNAGLALGVLFDDPEEALRAARRAVAQAGETAGYRLRALLRLTVVFQARGILTLPEAHDYVAEARTLAERSGDVLTRFSIESNLAAAYLDAGDVDTAEVLMSRATDVAGSGRMDMNRFIQSNNEAELLLSRCDYLAAAEAFTRASRYLGPTTPRYMRDLVTAGLGLCALERGDLAEARRREEDLSAPPQDWYFDPTTLIAFRARLLERRGLADEALRFLAKAANNLEGRLTTAWLKVVMLQVRLMAKVNPSEASHLAQTMARESDSLRLPHRRREFSDLAKRLR